MNFERIQDASGYVFYRIFSKYAKETISMDPNQLLDLQTWLNENEDSIREDSKAATEQAMGEEQAQALAETIRTQAKTWIESSDYSAFFHHEVFGSLEENICVVPAEFPYAGFVVLANWEVLDRAFHTPDEWQAFVNEIEERVKAVALDFKDKQPTEVAGVWQFQPDDEIEYTVHGQRQYARVLREETIDGHTLLYIRSLTDSSVQYSVPLEEVKTASRVIPGEGTVTHSFDKEE